MVKLATIREENLRYEHEHHTGFVCIFAGATSGIETATLERMVNIVSKSTFFVIGRSEESFAVLKDKLEKRNSTNKIVFFQSQFSLLSDVDAVSQRMEYEVKKVDYVFMSPGVYPL
ncbi:uncharacterized protein RCO7_10703 [Rhynchosporium graminicola]|uniref:Ketoreductase (KR) domain-containing protein n=1 Tax=Rhynchosporium graminicola TaxID=2792576 RepID=A0A1E1L5B0_9HELO|nr:uncharacterized protein RCO7_10703 [Rhynchosporium commune]